MKRICLAGAVAAALVANVALADTDAENAPEEATAAEKAPKPAPKAKKAHKKRAAAVEKAPEPAPPASWLDTLTITGHVETGMTVNFANPRDHINFGRLFDDRASQPLLNQAVLTAQRPLDPKATDYDFGFKVQTLFGSDARYTHFLGELDYIIHDRHQFDIVEAHALAHLPWLTEGGIDVKVGQFVTLEGAEVIYAPDNPLYSHTYIFNFGIPFKHTGVLAYTHVTSWLDIQTGLTTGVNTSIGYPGDNNRAVSFHGGLGLNLLDGALTVLATTHIGPENPAVPAVAAACGCTPSATLRYLNDVTITWKATDDLTFITDLNYIRDDGFNLDPITGFHHGVEGFGGAQYAIYKINDMLKIVGRGEIWRDRNGFFVAGFPHSLDFINIEHGFPTSPIVTAPPTTYGALTAGLTISPPIEKNPFITGITFRPEVRWDTSLNGTSPFAAGTRHSQVTFGFDMIAPFSIR